MAMLTGATMDYECSNCGELIEVSINDIGSIVECPHCKSKIKIADHGISDVVDDVTTQIDDFLDSRK